MMTRAAVFYGKYWISCFQEEGIILRDASEQYQQKHYNDNSELSVLFS